jgi:hypothetical protein
MESPNFMLVIAWEAFGLAMVVVAVLLFQNRKMHSLVEKLQARMHELVGELKKSREESGNKPAGQDSNYMSHINQQIEQTKKHHISFRSGQDIMLDLDPEAPLPRRTAALRHAVLIAEKEAHSQHTNKTNWDLLAARYQQLLDFNKTYDRNPAANAGELAQLQAELAISQTRIANLEKFKSLYFDLEKNWQASKGKAGGYFDEMSNLINQGRPAEDIIPLLNHFNTVYSDFNEQIEAGVNSLSPPLNAQAQNEINRLRNVTVDQHRTIAELQEKLSRASNDEQRASIIKELQRELHKQARYIQESETCIMLMEDELHSSKKEIDQLSARAAQVGPIRLRLKELESADTAHQSIIQSLKQDNFRLNQKLKTINETTPEETNESRALRKELTHIKAKYAELEERFLDLKLKG